MRRSHHVSRSRRAQIRDEAHQLYIVRRTEGLDADQIQDELMRAFPDELALGEARMYAMGWTVRVVREGLRRLATDEGLDSSSLEDGDIWRWLRGEVFPRDALERLCRLFQCHQSRLGWPSRGNEVPIDYNERAIRGHNSNRGVDSPIAANKVAPRATSHVSASGAILPIDWPVPEVAIQPPNHESSPSTAMQAFRDADRRVGGGHLYPLVVQYLQAAVAPHLFGTVIGADARTVFTAAGALTEMAGWMAYDAGRPRLAREHFHRALDLGRIGDDRELCAHILASTSHLASHMHRPDEAIRLARSGQATLTERPRPPELEARLLAMEARGFAALGEVKETVQLLRRAETTLHRASCAEPSQWISRFDDGSLATEAARCMQRLDQLGEAERLARRVVALRSGDRKRSRAFGQLILVSVLVAQGRCDEGCAVADEVLDATQSFGSVLVLEQLANLQNLLEPYRSARPVAELLARLEDVLPQSRRRYPWMAARDAGLGESGAQV